MKILITGGNGYIGLSLYRAFHSKYDVSTISRMDFDLTNSLAVSEFFKNKYFDVVLHCAIVGGSRLEKDDDTVLDNNLIMYYNLLANRHHFSRFINFGSGAEISDVVGMYGLSKSIISQSILPKDDFYNIRIFGVFDENESDTRFIKSNLKRYINKEPMLIHQNKFMSFFYMEDLVSLVDFYIFKNKNLPKESNCAYAELHSLKSITDFINTLDDYEVDVLYGELGMDDDYESDIFVPKHIKCVGLEQGIINTYNKLK